MSYQSCYEEIARLHCDAIAGGGRCSPWVPQAMYDATHTDTEKLARALVRPGQTVLDVGIGPGFLFESLQDIPDVKWHGVDVAQPYLDRLRVKFPGWVLANRNAECLDYPHLRFDVVFACDVLEHVLDLHEVMRGILRVLLPGGICLIRVPYREDLSGYCAESIRFEYLHVRDFSEYSLRLLIEKCHGQECLSVARGETAPSELFALVRKRA